MHPKNIQIENYSYDLPSERIAKFPLAERDQSKLLIYNQENIYQDVFKNIDKILPDDSILLFNETKVIQARLPFFKESGAKIEVFCLEPVSPTREIQLAFQQKSGVVWKCFVGNSKKWKEGFLKKIISINGRDVVLNIQRVGRDSESHLIEFSWGNEELTFSQILESVGLVPLPPYLNREAVKDDKDRYQTVYAKHDGSVAAPTAGLHFTPEILNRFSEKGMPVEEVTLHVGAGTFKPVSSDTIGGHEMHVEKIIVKKSTIEQLLSLSKKNVVAVGTTTVRTLESLYWFAAKLIHNPDTNFYIEQWDPYNEELRFDKPIDEMLEILIRHMNSNGLDVLHGETQLIIAPGYEFKVVDILITNFHQPQSTLLLLVSAFIGEQWKDVYEYALENNFRFLSYGDSCLFFKK